MRVRTPVALLRSLLGKYPWERYEPTYPPSYGLNSKKKKKKKKKKKNGGARGVMVIIVGNGQGNTSSNPGRDWLHFT